MPTITLICLSDATNPRATYCKNCNERNVSAVGFKRNPLDCWSDKNPIMFVFWKIRRYEDLLNIVPFTVLFIFLPTNTKIADNLSRAITSTTLTNLLFLLDR